MRARRYTRFDRLEIACEVISHFRGTAVVSSVCAQRLTVTALLTRDPMGRVPVRLGSTSNHEYWMLIVRSDVIYYLIVDPINDQISLTIDSFSASRFHPSKDVGGSLARKRVEFRAKQQGVLLEDEKLLMKSVSIG